MNIGVIAPSSNTWENQDVEYALDVVRSLGFNAVAGKHLYKRHGYLAGSDNQRAEDVNRMFADPDIHGIFCSRGGYGASRILPMLNYNVIRSNPKVLLGYSDITALHLAINGITGLITFHGPIAGQQFTDYTYQEFSRIIMRGEHPTSLAAPPRFPQVPGQAERHNRITRFVLGKATGPLVGGNLSLVTSLMGTPYEPDFRGKILFLEDVSEAPYSVDRMLTQLWLAGVFSQINGLIFGKFTDYEADAPSISMEAVLEQRCEGLSIPVMRGLMIGHVDDQSIIPVGANAELDADAGTLTLLGRALI
ncbi:MAG TPA: LD-carboxypeptidase [Gammaproteobacteria bacterium]|nr:LD-carboxypeptidase [Gammaproteobacteria bacterium]HIK70691.1 LD-carboxypeptidase [Pseudomonadales bacterium]